MPENKNQHYVPKCHLRPFSSKGGSAINVLNIKRRMAIPNAPIKGQCAKNYFYGEDRVLEKAFQTPEGRYAKIVASVSADPDRVRTQDLTELFEFALLQAFRTFGYVEKLFRVSEHHYDDMSNATSAGGEVPKMLHSIDDAIRMAMSHFVNMLPIASDLETCLIINRSRKSFVTSDDPVIHTNRYALQRLRRTAFGFSSSGAIIFFPLSPVLMLLAYDKNVYTAPKRKGRCLVLQHEGDIDALNQLQILHARENLYFPHWEERSELLSLVERYADVRPSEWHRFVHFEKVGESEFRETFKRVESIKLERGRQFLTSYQQVHVQPRDWPSLLRFKSKPRVVETKTAAGCLRPGNPALNRSRERWS